jgi:hypothetical protein
MRTKRGIVLLWALALIGVLLCIPINSNADIIQVDLLTLTSMGLDLPVTVYIGSFETVGTNAGFYNVELDVSTDPTWNKSFQSSSFCVEDRGIDYFSYTGYSLYDLIPPFTNAAWLMSTYLASATDSTTAASLQIAVWEAVLDPKPFDLSTGNFRLLGGLDPAQANAMLAELSAADLGSFNTAAYRIASDDGLGSSSGNQDVIVYNPAVPIPSALLLLGSGLMVFIGLRRNLGRR